MINKKVELLVEDKRIELFGDESFALSFSINDINDIGKKSAAYSKEISIPATDINNTIFTSLFDVTIEGGFNPISRKRAVLYVDSIPVMQGYFKMLSVTIKDGKNVTYNGQLFEEQINFVAALDDFLLENLSIPLTGITASLVSGPYVQVSTFQITGLGDRIGSGIYTSTGLNWCDASNYTGVTFSSGSWGLISQQDRSTAGIPAGTSWSPSNMGAYEATIDQRVEIDVYLDLRTISPASYNYRIIKSDYVSPTIGLYSDLVLTSGTFTSTGTLGATAILNLTAVTTNLGAGDKFRVEVWETTGKNYTTASGSTINGRIFTGTTFSTVTDYRATIGNMIRNMNTVNTSDDFPITFPLIDYSKKYSFSDKNLSSVYTYSPKNELYINAEDIRPMVFVKQTWDAIFKQAGFKYKSNFLNSDTFKKMVIGGSIGETEISSLVVETVVNDSNSAITGTTLPMSLAGRQDTQVVNPSGQVTNYRYSEMHMGDVRFASTAGNQKNFKINESVDSYITYIPSRNFVNANAYSVLYSAGVQTNYYGYDLTTVTSDSERYGVFMTAALSGKYRVHASLFASANPLLAGTTPQAIPVPIFLQIQKLSIGSYKYYPTSSTTPKYDSWTLVKQIKFVTSGSTTTPQDFSLVLDETIDLKKGDMIRVIIMGDPNKHVTGFSPGTLSQQINITVDPTKTFCRFYKMGTVFNAKLNNAASLLPKNFKQRDFILQLSKMFNLYFEADLEDSKTLLIEPRDTYYETGRILNWSRKIDYSKDYQIDILSHEFPKTQIFKYTDDEDGDYLSSEYANYTANKLVFGSYIFTSTNEYNTNEETLELKFAPSYTQRLPQSNVKITKIHNKDIYTPEYNGGTVQYKIKPRLMMYKRMAAPAPSTNFILYLGFASPAKFIPLTFLNYNTTSYNYVMQFYGYAGHLNDPDVPTFDLNWYTDMTYLPTTSGTTQNLINVFYKNQLIELTDQTARKVTCFVDLNAVDIANLRFSNVFYFDREYWRLIEISDYDTSSDVNKTTKCTFIKIVRAQTNALIDYQAFGYLGISGGSAGGILGNTDPE